MKTILILTSVGGGGQTTVNQSLQQMLNKDYAVKSELYFSHVINSVDPFSLATFGHFTGEDFYNYVQKKRCFKFMQSCYKASRWYYSLFAPLLIRQTIEYLEKQKPHLVISIIPIVDDIIVKSCQHLNIPIIILPPDLDISFYTQELTPPCYEKLYLALPFDNPMSREAMRAEYVQTENIIAVKYPLRKEFYEPKNIPALKKEWHVDDGRPVILLMMGAQGNLGSYTFSKELAKLSKPAHILICIGRNESIRRKLEKIRFPQHITPHIIGYTNRVADLMAIADLLISKTGGITVMEAFHSRLPIIADQTEFVLSWEYFHQLLLQKYGCGLILKNPNILAPFVQNLLSDPILLQEIKKNIAQMHNKKEIEIKDLIANILGTGASK